MSATLLITSSVSETNINTAKGLFYSEEVVDRTIISLDTLDLEENEIEELTSIFVNRTILLNNGQSTSFIEVTFLSKNPSEDKIRVVLNCFLDNIIEYAKDNIQVFESGNLIVSRHANTFIYIGPSYFSIISIGTLVSIFISVTFLSFKIFLSDRIHFYSELEESGFVIKQNLIDRHHFKNKMASRLFHILNNDGSKDSTINVHALVFPEDNFQKTTLLSEMLSNNVSLNKVLIMDFSKNNLSSTFKESFIQFIQEVSYDSEAPWSTQNGNGIENTLLCYSEGNLSLYLKNGKFDSLLASAKNYFKQIIIFLPPTSKSNIYLKFLEKTDLVSVVVTQKLTKVKDFEEVKKNLQNIPYSNIEFEYFESINFVRKLILKKGAHN